jgi:beta-glucuronidase
MKLVRAKFVLAALAALAGCGEPLSLDVAEIDGVPVLMQNGMPCFTRFNRTDHLLHDLAGTWKFKPDPADVGGRERWFAPGLDDSTWYKHPVPGSWNAQRPEWLAYTGAGWYRRSFHAPEEMAGRFNRLVFDGVSFRADLYLNGQFLARHSGGFTQWSVDVSDKLDYGGENLVALRVDNRRDFDSLPPLIAAGRPLGFWAYGGIQRRAELESGPETTLCKLAVDADAHGLLEGAGVIYRHGRGEVDANVTVRLLDLGGAELRLLLTWPVKIGPTGIAAFRFKYRLPGARLWSPRTPENRYRVEVEVVEPRGRERQEVEIGFRSFEFRGTQALLNGEPVFIRGVNRHEDDPRLGLVQTPARIREDMELLHRLHANLVRTAHYPDDPRWLDACDREGIMVMTEIPLYQAAWSRKSLRAVRRPELRRQAAIELLEMIERDRNHPAVVIWGLGNECFSFFPSVRGLYRDLYDTAKRFDPHRPAAFTVFTLPYRLTPLFEISAGVGDAIFLNEYFGWYFGEPADIGPVLERFHRKWPEKAIVISEMGGGAVRGLKPGGRLFPVGFGNARDYSEEFQDAIYREQLPLLKAKPYVAGVIPWVFADFRDDKRVDAPIPNFNLKGLLTYDRHPKQAFKTVAEFFAQVERSRDR